MRLFARLGEALARATESRRVGAEARRGQVTVVPYRGYGSQHEVFLIGRVYREPFAGVDRTKRTLWHGLARLWRWLLRRGIGEAELIAAFAGVEQRVSTDRDGYFRVHIELQQAPAPERLWHDMAITLIAPTSIATQAQIYIPPSRARFVVISDIDDTVMLTGVANKLLMMWRLFGQRAKSRTAFPGMAAFLSALHEGRGGDEANPMLYVSRAPWSIYEILDEFFNLNAIPVGPILFLREWGLTIQNPLPRRATDHKLDLIRNMLALYDQLPLILIGDSGQHDPEVYAHVVHEHPGRVRAVYIRNVSRGGSREREIDQLARQVLEAGSTLLLAPDTLAMARHAVEQGLIAESALAAVGEEREAQAEEEQQLASDD